MPQRVIRAQTEPVKHLVDLCSSCSSCSVTVHSSLSRPPITAPRSSSSSPHPLPTCGGLVRPGDAGLFSGGEWPAGSGAMLTVNLEGLEMIGVLVVVVLFVKVLERFGLLAASYDGKETPSAGRGGREAGGVFFFFLFGSGHLLLES